MYLCWDDYRISMAIIRIRFKPTLYIVKIIINYSYSNSKRRVWAHEVWHMSPGELVLQVRVIRMRISILLWLHWSQVDTLTTNQRGGWPLLWPIWGLHSVWQNRHNITTQSQTQPSKAERIVRIFKTFLLVTEILFLFFIG